MADAKIIQLGSRGRAGRGSGSSPSASARRLAVPQAARRSQPRDEPAPDPPYESAEAPATTLSTLVSQLVRLASGSLGSLRSVPITQVRDFAADPLHGLVSVAQAFGVELGGLAGGNCGVSFVPGCAATTRSMSSDSTLSSPPRSIFRCFAGSRSHGSGSRFEEPRTYPPMVRRCWSPITPAPCHSTE